MRMNLVFVNDSKAVAGKIFSKELLNPGVGGIEYLTAVLVMKLAKKYPFLSMTILTSDMFSFDEDMPNISIETYKDAMELSNYWQPGNLLVLTTSFIGSLEKSFLEVAKHDIILWSHHPSDWQTLKFKKYCRALVSTGLYQFNSNLKYHRNHLLIPNYYVPLRYKKKNKTNNNDIKNFLFLGALVPAKGFHHVLSQWAGIKQIYPDAHLHVIGGSALYGLSVDGGSPIPCSEEYKRILLDIMHKNNLSFHDITFYGSMGEERFEVYQKADIAIINPSGKSESFSFNLHECLDFGLPTFASNRFGLNDVMKHFPAFALTKPDTLTKMIKNILSDNSALVEWYTNRDEKLKEIVNRNDEILQMWHDLFLSKPNSLHDIEINKETLRAYFLSILGRLKFLITSLGIVKK
jgi:glycosyltransferase involved in cell wall biosynthesis